MNAPFYGTAFCGGPLVGDNIVRMIFLDEAGLGNEQREPFLVIAGIIVNADKQWKAIERRLGEFRRFVPPEAPLDYAFHATELYSGGKYFTRERYSRAERWSILESLLNIPAEFNLPVVHTYVNRTAKPGDLPGAYSTAFINTVSNAEAYLRIMPSDEVGMVIFEDNPEMRAHVRFMQWAAQDQKNLINLGAVERDRYWLTRIVGEPHFEGKGPLSLLQIADVCAFAIKRYVMKKPDAERFVEPLWPQLIGSAKPRTDRDEQERSS